MANLDFPSSPTVGQVYTVNGKSWVWNGFAWAIQRTGQPGKSAYELAVENGFVGTEAQWIASLKGDKGDKGDQGIQGEQGPRGDKGDPGDRGSDGTNGTDGQDGVGVPTGGTNGQILAKASDNPFDTHWVTPDFMSDYTVPLGGNQGQFLGKNSATDGDFAWLNLPNGGSGTPELPAGGNEGQVLTKNSASDGDVKWADPATGTGVPDGGTTGQVLTKNSNFNGDATWHDAKSVPDGGTTGQFLAKASSTNGDAEWVDAPSGTFVDAPSDGKNYLRKNATWNELTPARVLPTGGTTGQLLAKASSTDADVSWVDSRGISDAPNDGFRYARRNGAWESFSLGSENNFVGSYKGTWGVPMVYITKTFDDLSIPKDWTLTSNIRGTMSIVDSPDSAIGTSKALTFPSDGVNNGCNMNLSFGCQAAGSFNHLKVRYWTNGENGFDGFRINVDGSQVFQDLANQAGYRETTQTLAAGSHTITLRYTSDGLYGSGFQNVRFSRIEYPVPDPNGYRYSDTVTWKGASWMCVLSSTTAEPGTNTDWVRLGSQYRFGTFITNTPGSGEILLMHVVSDAFVLPANLAGTRVYVGTNPTADTTFSLRKNATKVGTIVVSTNGTVTMSSSEISVAVGDLLSLVASSVSNDISNCSFTFRGI